MLLLLPLLSASAATSTQPLSMHSASPGARSRIIPRATQPQLNIAWEAITLSANPMAILPVVFAAGWLSTPIIASTSLRDSAFIQNSGKKMKVMAKEKPRLKGVRLTQEVRDIADANMVKKYNANELEVLWAALLACCDGDAQTAALAVRACPQIINPSYSFCNTMLESKKALLSLMSEEEALEVIGKNPAVLQCGPSLEDVSAAEVKAIAALRAFGTALFPAQALRWAAVATLATAVFAVIFLQNSDDPTIAAVLDVLRPTLGAILGGSFAFAAYAAVRSS